MAPKIGLYAHACSVGAHNIGVDRTVLSVRGLNIERPALFRTPHMGLVHWPWCARKSFLISVDFARRNRFCTLGLGVRNGGEAVLVVEIED